MTEIDLEAVPEGVLLPVQAQPKARRNGFNGIHDGRLKVQVTQAPEKGKANRSVIRLLADTFGVAPSRIALIAGAASSDKAGATINRARRVERIPRVYALHRV